MTEPTLQIENNVQEKMWIAIIQRMESVYAELANTTMEFEKKNRELSGAQELTDTIMRSMVDALFVADSQGRIQLVNRAALDLTGYSEEEIVGRHIDLVFGRGPKRDRLTFKGPRIQKIFHKGVPLDAEVDLWTREGERIPMSLNGSLMRDKTGEVHGVLLVARDLRQTKALIAEAAAAEAHRAKADELEKAYTELQSLQARMIQTEKMASLGKLSAGVAHEINNPLAGITIYSHLVMEDLPPGSPLRENMGKVVQLAARTKEIVKNLLDFARQSEPKTEDYNINDVLEGVLTILEKQVLFQNIEIVRRLQTGLPQVLVDAGQIQQVFMNMIINAAEAMNGQGVLTLATATDQSKQQVMITISDTGIGIPKENLAHLFEPFFTTKEAGKGTGLGLSICYGIVRRHKGQIDVESQPERGTTFTISLPRGGIQ